MGWWQVGNAGTNEEDRATGLLWGDELADILDDALDAIRAVYEREWGRPVSAAELEAGWRFSMGSTDEGAGPALRA